MNQMVNGLGSNPRNVLDITKNASDFSSTFYKSHVKRDRVPPSPHFFFLSLSPSWEIFVNISLNFGWLGYRDTADILLELLVLDLIQSCF